MSSATPTTAEKEVMRAHADLHGHGAGEGHVAGEAEFVEVERGTQRFVRVTVRLRGDPATVRPGLHGVHIHESASCEHGEPGAAPFMSAGGHFDPGPAGNVDPDVNHPYHMGDLPNLEVGPDGAGLLEAFSTRITLSDGPLSILAGAGTSLMIHGNPDQGISGPSKSGVSGGPRLACGVIRAVPSETPWP